MRQHEEKLTKLLQEKAAGVRAGAELLVSKTRDWQVIKQFLSNKVSDLKLSKDQQNKLDRYQFIYAQLSKGQFTKAQVIEATSKMFSISIQQVYDDIKCTQEIFSTVITLNKMFELQLELESAKDLKRKCIEIGDLKTAAIVQKNIIALNDMIPEEETHDGADFEGHTLEALFDPRLLGSPEINMREVLDAINAKRNIKIETDMFETLPFTETSNEKTDTLQ